MLSQALAHLKRAEKALNTGQPNLGILYMNASLDSLSAHRDGDDDAS